MARFRYFSCLRSTNGETEDPWERKDRYGTEDVPEDEDESRIELYQAEIECNVAKARVFKSTELIVATDTFNPGHVLGKGRLGCVYKGILEDEQEVSVKRFDGKEELCAEVQMLSCVEHPNIVKMIGYCDKGEDHIVVYEFMPLRSLNLHLHDLKPGKKPLDWKTRMKIAEGVAKALEYLHDQKDPPVICCNLKASGILLDENYNPKLSDFCSAQLGLTWKYSPVKSGIMLTFGYGAPEYAVCGKLTSKSDIYSFGVVLLELICGRKAIDGTITNWSGERNIVSWARPFLSESKFLQLADPLMKGQYPYHGLVQALGLAKMCVQEEPRNRPLTAEVVTTLSNIVSQTYEEACGTSEADPLTSSTMVHRALAVA
ncbi:hypothetical protein MKW92_009331 [Papaver armeniacum]|nr:hypothetical protein MKW92_009331 [Papaver armeniacum]